MTFDRTSSARARGAGALALLLVAACDVRSTVGYEEGLGAGDHCGPDAPIATCPTGHCVVTDLFAGVSGAEAIAVDAESVYFVTSPTVLGKRTNDGGPLVELVSDLDQMERFTVDDENVYWTEYDSVVRAVPKTGGESFLVASAFGHPTDIAVDAANVYTVLPESNEVFMAPKHSGDPSHLSGQPDPQEIAVDADHVYWINRGSTGSGDGQLVRAARGDLTTAEVLLSDLDAPIRLGLGDDDVYWASTSAVFRVAKSGGAPLPVATGFSEVRALAVVAGTLYVADGGGLTTLPAAGGAITVLDSRPISAMALGCSGIYGTTWFEELVIRYGP